MTEDVGLAQLKPLEDTNGFFPGQLGEQFSKGGVSEIEEALKAEILSMEDFLRAEQSLERTPATLDEIEMAEIMATTRIEDHHDGTTFNYSLMETGREAQGGKGDENTETSLGRRKVGIQDPDAFKKKEEKKRAQYLALELAQHQARELERMYARLAEIEQEIEDLRADNARLEREIEDLRADNARLEQENAQLKLENAEIEELMGEVDDLNSSNPSARRTARANAENLLRMYGRSIDEFTKEDGSIDEDKYNQFLLDQLNQNNNQIEQNNNQIEQNNGQVEQRNDQVEQNNDKIEGLGEEAEDLTSKVNAVTSNNDISPRFSVTSRSTTDEAMSDVAYVDATFSSDNLETDGAFSSIQSEEVASLDAFDSFDSGDAFGSAETELASVDAFGNSDELNEDYAFSESEQIALNAFDADSSVGSFSGTDQDSESGITAHFASKVSPEDVTAEPAPEGNNLEQDRQMAFTGGSTTAFTA